MTHLINLVYLVLIKKLMLRYVKKSFLKVSQDFFLESSH